MIEYRKASQNDVDQLVNARVKQLIDEGYQQTNDINADLKTFFSESLANDSLISLLGIYEEAIVATAGLCFYQLPPSFSNPTGKVAHITNMYTEEAFRKQGIASYLFDLLLKEAKNLNYTSVRLHASDKGKSIYVKAGFVTTDGYMAKKL